MLIAEFRLLRLEVTGRQYCSHRHIALSHYLEVSRKATGAARHHTDQD